MLPPYYNNHGLLQQQASDLSQQSHNILSLSQQSQALSQTLNNSLHQIHQRSSSQNSQDSGGEQLNNHHNHINNSISNHHKNINHPESNESCNSEGDSESLTRFGFCVLNLLSILSDFLSEELTIEMARTKG